MGFSPASAWCARLATPSSAAFSSSSSSGSGSGNSRRKSLSSGGERSFRDRKSAGGVRGGGGGLFSSPDQSIFEKKSEILPRRWRHCPHGEGGDLMLRLNGTSQIRQWSKLLLPSIIGSLKQQQHLLQQEQQQQQQHHRASSLFSRSRQSSAPSLPSSFLAPPSSSTSLGSLKGQQQWKGYHDEDASRASCHHDGTFFECRKGGGVGRWREAAGASRTYCSCDDGCRCRTSIHACEDGWRRRRSMHRSARSETTTTSSSSCSSSPLSVHRESAMAAVPGRMATNEAQQTIQRPVTRAGVGLHHGYHNIVRLVPAMAGEGRYFVRMPEMRPRVSSPPPPDKDFTELWKEWQASREDQRRPLQSGRTERMDGKQEEEEDEERLAATVDCVTGTLLSTNLGGGTWRDAGMGRGGGRKAEHHALCVHTVEHLLSALEGMGVDNVRIEIGWDRSAGAAAVSGGNDVEIPILDGSAKPWVEAIREAGVAVAKDARGHFRKRWLIKPENPVIVYEGDSFVMAIPSASTQITYGIDFPQLPVVGRQWFTWRPDVRAAAKQGGGPNGGYAYGGYDSHVAPARTFGILEQLEELRAKGLIKGGSLENALVCSMNSGWVNPPLRFENEPCRHKMLDLIGDLSLCAHGGNPGFPLAHVVAYKASHALHIRFARALLEEALLSYNIQEEEEEEEEEEEVEEEAEEVGGSNTGRMTMDSVARTFEGGLDKCEA
ncbi:hypothetical protein CBR_g12524 [Chara braunii]|uniref:UDP-3-O-acyl-N-acetylglucosamine deacetylase n=1 Tax=Chara braunii TaxID=69332 RepID=A0A388JSL3_CHABU|nr:hypothetical protein CBR_g12524 [Chara braunii]|eukprot:GBG60786.1 hypothetical protein CBR_g12524 [Chara braunii]